MEREASPDGDGSFIGAPVRRLEDAPLLRGAGRYLADVRQPGEVHVHFVRSPHAHARLLRVDADAARSCPGVVGVFTARDLPPSHPLPVYPMIPDATIAGQPPLATDAVRFVGEPVAAVVAETPAVAADAAERLRVDYEPMAPAMTVAGALAATAPHVHAAVPGNLIVTARAGRGDVAGAFARADRVIDVAIDSGRVAALPLEPRGIVARHDPATGEVTVWCSTQVPHRVRSELAVALAVPESSIRVVVPDVGGGFGAKTSAYQEELVAVLLARAVGRPVKWVATRSEDLQASTHARGCRVHARAAFSGDGHLLGLDVRAVFDLGAWVLPLGLVPPARMFVLVPGPYAVRDVLSEVRCVHTNTAPTGPYRGAGRPEATFVIERVMDRAARELGLDPAEIRRRNLVSADAFPYTTATGLVYDSGDYDRALARLLAIADYPALRAEQRAARARGEFVGVGLSTFVEPSGGAVWEGGHVRVERSGEITASTGAGPHGQGTVTALAQIVATAFRVPLEAVRIRYGDTTTTPPGVGSFGSRTVAMAGSALTEAARRVTHKIRRIAAALLECAEHDLEPAAGGLRVVGTSRCVTLREIARAAYTGVKLPEGEEPGLEATALYRQPAEMFAFGAHLAVVRVDPETGAVRVERMVAVDDHGVVVNPLLTEGQTHGALTQALGQVLLEGVVYDAGGQLLTATLMDYAAPRADSVPPFVLAHTVTPTPLNPLGAKGAGEAATVGAPPALVGAIVDALTPCGAHHLDTPVRAETIWAMLHAPRP
jgi:aerobic carbon-monoxide dehydrogenase large subunit